MNSEYCRHYKAGDCIRYEEGVPSKQCGDCEDFEMMTYTEMTVRRLERKAQQKKGFNSVKDVKIILRKCPFCGSDDVKINYPYSYLGSSVSCVQCYGCGCTTAVFDSEDKTIEAWNRRCDDGSNQK